MSFVGALILGGIVFLLMTNPLIFALLFVPIVVIVLISFIKWLKK